MTKHVDQILSSLSRRLKGRSCIVTGASGFLGSHLARHVGHMPNMIAVSRKGQVPGWRCSVNLDLTDREAVWSALDRERPAIVLHAAAETNVDRCDREPGIAIATNVDTTNHLVDWINTKSQKSLIAYISTDQVYDGPSPHDIRRVWPRNIYSLTKYVAEELARTCAHHLIIRTNFVGWAQDGLSFADWLVTSFKEKRQITLLEDVFFNPLAADDLTCILLDMLGRGVESTFNLGAQGNGCSKAEFGLALGSRLGLDMTAARVGTISDLKLTAYRPRDMRMDVQTITDVLGYHLPTMQDTLNSLVAEYQRYSLN